MSGPQDRPARRLRILSEETVRVASPDGGDGGDGGEEIENPYWADEDPPPHPDPSLGCVRRGLCCRSSPGWFAPGEVEKAAALLGLAPDAFVRRFLIIDRVELDGAPVEVFAPVKLDRFGEPARRPATRVDDWYRILRGRCVFFDGAGCGIYAARPIECARYVCTNDPSENLSHLDIARLWRGDPID